MSIIIIIQTLFADFTKILVVGGYSDNTVEYFDSVEVFDLTSEVQSCAAPANYPFPVHLMVGTLFDGMPLICGGHDATEPEPRLYTNKCYQYRHSDNSWLPTDQNMFDGRYGHMGSMVDSKTFLISGGDYEPQLVMDSTEVWQDDHFDYGPMLPSARRYHCQLTLNATHVILLGGYDGTAEFRDLYPGLCRIGFGILIWDFKSP